MTYPLLSQDYYYHVFSRANGSELLFKDVTDYRLFELLISRHLESQFEIHAYCLLSNHFHFLLKPKRNEKSRDLVGFVGRNKSKAPSMTIRKFLISYSKSYNKKYQRKGSLFMRPFKRKKISSDAHYSKMIHYIHVNPVHHGYVDDIEQWHYSSYHELICDSPSFLSRNQVIRFFGGINAYREFHKQPIGIKVKGEYIDDV